MVQLELKSCWFDPEIPFVTTAIDTHDPATQLFYAAVSNSKKAALDQIYCSTREDQFQQETVLRGKLPKDTTVRPC